MSLADLSYLIRKINTPMSQSTVKKHVEKAFRVMEPFNESDKTMRGRCNSRWKRCSAKVRQQALMLLLRN